MFRLLSSPQKKMFPMFSSPFSTKPLIYRGVLINPLNTFFQTERSPKKIFQEVSRLHGYVNMNEALQDIGDHERGKLINLAARVGSDQFVKDISSRFAFLEFFKEPKPDCATMVPLQNLKALNVRFGAIAYRDDEFEELSNNKDRYFMDLVVKSKFENDADNLFDAYEKLGVSRVLIVADEIQRYPRELGNVVMWGRDVQSVGEIEEIVRGID